MDGWMNGERNGWGMDGWTSGRMIRGMGRWTDGWMDGWMDTWMHDRQDCGIERWLAGWPGWQHHQLEAFASALPFGEAAPLDAASSPGSEGSQWAKHPGTTKPPTHTTTTFEANLTGTHNRLIRHPSMTLHLILAPLPPRPCPWPSSKNIQVFSM